MLTENCSSSSTESGKLQDTEVAHGKIPRLYTLPTEGQKEDARKTTPPATAPKRRDDLGITLPKEAEDLRPENCATRMKESKRTWRDAKTYRVLGLEASLLPKWLFRPREPTDSMQSLSNYERHFFFPAHLEQKILKFVWEHKRPQAGKAILRNRNGAGGLGPPDFRPHCEATVIRAVQTWHRNAEQNRKSRRKPTQTQPVHLNKGGKRMQRRRSLQWVVLGQLDSYTQKELN